MNATEAIRRMRSVIRRPHKTLATEDSYMRWLRHYMGARSETLHRLSKEQKPERFLTDLNLKQDVAASTHNQGVNAIAFFYRDMLGTTLYDVDALRATGPVLPGHAPIISKTRMLLQAVCDLAG
jgi:hypothetical protein